MEFVPAVTLWVLTLVRVPIAFDRRRRSVFFATGLAAAACTLYVPAVYYGADPLFGGKNRVGLIMLTLLLLGFWQFRTAILQAVVTDKGRRRRQLTLGRWATGAVCATVFEGFAASRVDVTDQNLPLTYGSQPGMALFLWAGSAFIIWVCLDIAHVCRQNVPHMRTKEFRAAFILVGIGCLLFALMLVDRLLYGTLAYTEGAASEAATVLTNLYWIGETSAVLLVSLGLLLPRLPGRIHHSSFDLRARLLLFEIDPIWNLVATDQPQLVLSTGRTRHLAFLRRHPEIQLHRSLVEIRDCEMANPAAAARLHAKDRAAVERAESLLEKYCGLQPI